MIDKITNLQKLKSFTILIAKMFWSCFVFSFFGSILKLIFRILVIAAFSPIYGLYNPSTSNEWVIQSATYVRRHVPNLFIRVDFTKSENLDNQSTPSKYVSDASPMQKKISRDGAAEDLSP